ncbi:MAG: 23S rRNA (guanosine(2251)-2'-O)-methyltransferase RlmB [Anaerolineales bacterium]|nr:23S rRNA (guanosine(2251)-2'-O)-methyltransferase RlmB [Anaerolineales bacterium]
MREWIYGRNPVYETLRANRRRVFRLMVAQGAQEKGRLADALRLARSKRLPIESVLHGQLETLAPGSQGVALEAGVYPYSDPDQILGTADELGEPPFLLVLDALQDPQNLGTLLRTAESVGVHGVFLPLRHAVAITPAVVNASSGASEHLLVAQANLAQVLQRLKAAGVWVVGLEDSPEAMLPEQVDLRGPLAFVIGSEGAGMRRLVRSSCDWLMRLPMRGRVESLNAAVAGSIALYLGWQARGYPGSKGENGRSPLTGG